MPSPVLLLPADPDWPRQAQALLAELRALLGEPAGWRWEPIGSTAVPGLCAKPVLDLMLGLPTLAALAPHQPTLAAAGWRYRPEYEAELPERRYFVREAGLGRLRAHLHAVEAGAALWRRHLGFRDALRERADWREAYAALKQALARRHADDKPAYQAGKAGFIAGHLAALGL
jgi:GrpB-like predicted nucleotidyltransferase (UPF0157 family)